MNMQQFHILNFKKNILSLKKLIKNLEQEAFFFTLP